MKFHLTRGWSLPFLSVFCIIAFWLNGGGGTKLHDKHHHTLLFFRQNDHSSKIINTTIVFSCQEILITRVWFLLFLSKGGMQTKWQAPFCIWKARRQRTLLIQAHFTLAFDLGKSIPPEVRLFPHSCSHWLFNYLMNYDLPSFVLGAEDRKMLKEVQAAWELTVQWSY